MEARAGRDPASGPSAGRAATRRGFLAALARVTAGGAILVEAVVRAEIGAGLFSSAALDDHTRGRVLRLLVGG